MERGQYGFLYRGRGIVHWDDNVDLYSSYLGHPRWLSVIPLCVVVLAFAIVAQGLCHPSTEYLYRLPVKVNRKDDKNFFLKNRLVEEI